MPGSVPVCSRSAFSSTVSITVSIMSSMMLSGHWILRQRAPLPRVFHGMFGLSRMRFG